MSTFDSTGLMMDRYADLLEAAILAAQAKWGDGIKTDEDELLGHLLRQVCLLGGELNELLQDVYDSKSVSKAATSELLAKMTWRCRLSTAMKALELSTTLLSRGSSTRRRACCNSSDLSDRSAERNSVSSGWRIEMGVSKGSPSHGGLHP